MSRRKCEFDDLINAQGSAYRFGTWMRSRRCIAMHRLDPGSVGLHAFIVGAIVVGLPMLILSTEQDLAHFVPF